jgi:alpha-tubulin suppressor-like RCC1 family protein
MKHLIFGVLTLAIICLDPPSFGGRCPAGQFAPGALTYWANWAMQPRQKAMCRCRSRGSATWLLWRQGGVYSLVLRSDGTVWTWGDNGGGELGFSTTETCFLGEACSTVPGQVSGLSGVVAVTGGLGRSLALKEGGMLWAWGDEPRATAPTRAATHLSRFRAYSLP